MMARELDAPDLRVESRASQVQGVGPVRWPAPTTAGRGRGPYRGHTQGGPKVPVDRGRYSTGFPGRGIGKQRAFALNGSTLLSSPLSGDLQSCSLYSMVWPTTPSLTICQRCML